MHRVGVLALDGVIPFDLGIPARVFGAARDATGARLYEVFTCALAARPVRTSQDMTLVVDRDERALALADTVVIATHELESGSLATSGVLPADVAAALGHVRSDARLVSICTGSFVLAAAGLLDGRLATTHWLETARFQRLFPKVRVDPDVLFVDDGRILTSAGAAAGIDLCLHIIRSDHGSEIASAAARRCVVPPWREGGQAQFIEHPVPEATDTTTAAARTWALERLDQSLSLADLAATAHVSVRTLTRRFRAEVGTSPTRWLIQQRVDRARRLLEISELPVEAIAHETGFGTAASLRQHLRDAIGVSPTAYRKTFRGRPRRNPAIRLQLLDRGRDRATQAAVDYELRSPHG
ncbi:MAG: helix-turn-helix domain-containing protein [Chloroflexi bacterium]|nr:helix-turn-helix domain-containing protein [Chloroflexota bacterium]